MLWLGLHVRRSISHPDDTIEQIGRSFAASSCNFCDAQASPLLERDLEGRTRSYTIAHKLAHLLL